MTFTTWNSGEWSPTWTRGLFCAWFSSTERKQGTVVKEQKTDTDWQKQQRSTLHSFLLLHPEKYCNADGRASVEITIKRKTKYVLAQLFAKNQRSSTSPGTNTSSSFSSLTALQTFGTIFCSSNTPWSLLPQAFAVPVPPVYNMRPLEICVSVSLISFRSPFKCQP